MKKKFIFATTLLLGSLSMFSACSSEDEGIPGWPWEDPQPEVEPTYEFNFAPAGWTDVTANYGDMQRNIKVFKSPSQLGGVDANAYIAVCDMKDGAQWNVLGDLGYCDDSYITNYGASSTHTPSQWYDETKAPVIINGGLYFYAAKSDGSPFYVSQNLAVRDGNIIATNQTYWVEDWSSDPLVMWYPTIGAFYQDAQGNCHTTWTYTTWQGITYSYSEPADNSLSKDPLEVPSATFPVEATTFEAQNAIGGVGVLLKNGEIRNTWAQELMGVSADSRQPRTAIGSTADGKLIFFVCEGRSTFPGFTTGEVAQIMSDLGCTEALNLDGGGSSCMLINGQETIKPSDGSQRSVLTGVRMF